VPEEVEKAIDSRSSMRVIDDLARYQQYQLGAAMPVAAANPAGGLAGAGVGVGMGVAVAGRMLPGPGGAAPAPQAPPPPPLPPAWHVAQGGQATGPFDADQLARAAAAGTLRPDTLVWTPGMAAWAPAGQVPQLAALFTPNPR
jgi:hypothetical protein